MREILTTYRWLALFNVAYVVPFALYYVAIQNFEFLWYIAVFLFFFVLIGSTLHKTNFPKSVLWLVSIWGLLHMAGGGVRTGDTVLYGYQLFHIVGSGDAFVLKYDQVVHFFGFFATTFVMFHLFRQFVGLERGFKTLLYAAALSAIGLSAINEIVEFIAVIASPETGVGGYYNTAIDLVFNTLGATTAGIVLYFSRRSKSSSL